MPGEFRRAAARKGMNSPEFQLMVECCRGAFSHSHLAVARALGAKVDWQRFLRLVRFHRVQALAWNWLSAVQSAVPADVAAALAGDAMEIVAANLRLTAEARRLKTAFEGAAIDILFLKGLTVGQLAYANPQLKMAWDTDILVGPDQLMAAARVLEDCGYAQKVPVAPSKLQSWHRKCKDSLWQSGRLHVELHTRLTENKALLPTLNVHSPSREISIAPGVALPTFAEEELFAYLCVHGSSSLWFRFKWITDLAAILHQYDGARVRHLYHRSKALGAGRASGSALLLADEFYGVLGDPSLRSEIERDPGNVWLFRAASRQLAGRDEPVEPTSRLFGTTAIHYAQLMIQPGAAFKFAEFVRQLRSVVR